MPDWGMGNSIALLSAAGLLSLVGTMAASRLMPIEPFSGGPRTGPHRIILASIFFTATAWLLFLAAFKLRFPRLDPIIPGQATLEALCIAALGSIISVTVAARAGRSVRNSVFAGSIMAASVSCMVFAGMSGLAAPSYLAYDLEDVVGTMAVGGALWAAGIWLRGRGQRRRYSAGILMAASLMLISHLSLFAVLPFSEWRTASQLPEAIEFRPVTIIFLCELGVTLALGLAGEGVDRRSAALVARENERLRQFTDSTFEALLIHRDGAVLDANNTFCDLVGSPLPEVRGRRVEDFLRDGEAGTHLSPVTGRPEAFETEIATSNGVAVPVEVLSRDLRFAGGAARVTAVRDIRERRAAEESIRFLACHDSLTGLPNRVLFQDAIARELASAKRQGSQLAVLGIDLDRFKHVNDTLGHWAGDQLLQQVAERLRQCVRDGDIAARIGGDEFVLLQTDASQPEASSVLARRIIETLSRPYDLAGNQMTIGASVGIALSPRDGEEADSLVRNADIALYRAKSIERGTVCFFQRGMDTQLQERRALEQDIARATASGDFDLAWQPQFSIASPMRTEGFEALLRWRHPVLGDLPPERFVPLAEESGLIVPIGAWVLKSACQEAADWPVPLHVAVNVSPRQFVVGDFVALVDDALGTTGLSPDRLEIEITETLLMKDGDAALGVLRQMKRRGLRIALDDFGTGYSSLSYLQRFPFDKVKIDRSFVLALSTSEDARAIVSAILAMARQLRLEVTAEGVETCEQLEFLRAQRCDQVQGYLLARPLTRQQLADYWGPLQYEARGEVWALDSA
jgi:diguanylate cyclase (GGDEF)-like protein/PAS domain S-box-containing protein